MLKMSLTELRAFLVAEFPQVSGDFEILDVAPMELSMRLCTASRHLRPGGTVSGPAMFTLVDVAMYLTILAMIGPQALAVTTNCSIDFMRKPVAGTDMVARARLHKLGRVLAVGDVMLYSDGQAAPVARAGLTYSIPPTPNLAT
jgi:uncharacterized protein (TIGR00369 family)